MWPIAVGASVLSNVYGWRNKEMTTREFIQATVLDAVSLAPFRAVRYIGNLSRHAKIQSLTRASAGSVSMRHARVPKRLPNATLADSWRYRRFVSVYRTVWHGGWGFYSATSFR